MAKLTSKLKYVQAGKIILEMTADAASEQWRLLQHAELVMGLQLQLQSIALPACVREMVTSVQSIGKMADISCSINANSSACSG